MFDQQERCAEEVPVSQDSFAEAVATVMKKLRPDYLGETSDAKLYHDALAIAMKQTYPDYYTYHPNSDQDSEEEEDAEQEKTTTNFDNPVDNPVDTESFMTDVVERSLSTTELHRNALDTVMNRLYPNYVGEDSDEEFDRIRKENEEYALECPADEDTVKLYRNALDTVMNRLYPNHVGGDDCVPDEPFVFVFPQDEGQDDQVTLDHRDKLNEHFLRQQKDEEKNEENDSPSIEWNTYEGLMQWHRKERALQYFGNEEEKEEVVVEHIEKVAYDPYEDLYLEFPNEEQDDSEWWAEQLGRETYVSPLTPLRPS